MYKVFFATGSRADYGIMRNYLRLLDNDANIELSILVTGALLSKEFGRQVELIYNDGFKVEEEIELPICTDSTKATVHTMAVALDKFGVFFAENKPDLLIVLGDRYEMLSVATAAAMNRIPILHIHGGEATFGNYDEFIRHAITKMSMYHFTATEEYRRRVIQLGENPEYVFNLGALGAENCLDIDYKLVSKSVRELEGRKYFVVLFHPETLTGASPLKQIDELLSAVDNYKEYTFVFIGSNADTHSDVIRSRVQNYVKDNENTVYFENLSTAGYHSLVKNSLGLIGNSSSGVIEAPSLGALTINIGHRQDGRVRGDSIIDVSCEKEEISKAIDSVVKGKNENPIYNPYYKKNTADNYYLQTNRILQMQKSSSINEPKKFYDLSVGFPENM